jgi:hypothetical protein
VRRLPVVGLALLIACGGGGAGDPDGGDDGDGATGDGASADGATPDAAASCAPTAGATRWIEEGEALTATVACATGDEPGDDGFEVTGLPAGATFDAATATISFTPGLDQAAVYTIGLAAPSLGETGELVIGVADKFDDAGNVLVVDPAAYPMEYGLPVFFISPRPTGTAYVETSVVYRGQSYETLAKLRGASSLSYPKKSMTIDFSGNKLTDEDYGFDEEKKIVLTSTFDDNAYLRVQLVWDLWNRLDPTVPVASTMAVVYIDGVYEGIYTFMDHIDDELMDSAGLPEAGNLYKAVNHDANFKLTKANGAAKATLHDGYDKKHGLPDPGTAGAWDDLDALVDFVANSDATTFRTTLPTTVHLPDFEAWWLLATFCKLNDSAGKNSYLHHSTVTPWHVVPWDFNDSFGQAWETRRQTASPVNLYTGNNKIFERVLADDELGAAWEARYATELAAGGAFDQAWILARIDELAASLLPSALRDERKWGDDYVAFSRWSNRVNEGAAQAFLTHVQEVAYVRQWVEERWAALDALY